MMLHSTFLFTGSDPLLKLLYEQEVQVSNELPLCDNPSIWLYRDIISVKHLMQKVDNHGNKCPILRLFLKKVIYIIKNNKNLNRLELLKSYQLIDVQNKPLKQNYNMRCFIHYVNKPML